ncbi:hypothetical protein OPV22_028283 [Ensete ventricosum]|uniref:Uncharacterized protein n=1 Tax=Ensete ventricosum TaxID=4639 RepID=A0AAV8Q002_ENSVE|nr:hypothetical protein OPV22_028283 [Ensete ventricosum]
MRQSDSEEEEDRAFFEPQGEMVRRVGHLRQPMMTAGHPLPKYHALSNHNSSLRCVNGGTKWDPFEIRVRKSGNDRRSTPSIYLVRVHRTLKLAASARRRDLLRAPTAPRVLL